MSSEQYQRLGWWWLIDLLSETVIMVLMHLSFIIMTVAFSLQVLRKGTDSCWVRAENLNFCSDIGAETFDDAYTNESLTIMALTGRRIKKEQS